MIAAASLAARAVTIDPDQADYYRGLGEDLFSRWEDVTGEAVLYTTWAARDDGLLPRNLGYTIEADDVGRWTLQGLVDAHAKPKAKNKRRKRR